MSKVFFNHIAGLRGIAILLVILFHLNSAFLPYGFYGVDIFLVISGYLLFLSLQKSNYNLNVREFATKKLFRILPPLVIITLCILLSALYFQDCEDIIGTSRAGRYTLFFKVNDFLRRTQEDYFAADALECPFLHMWYLAVTIHLYLMFAVGCIVCKYIPRKLSISLVWVIGLASFFYGYSYQIHNILQSIGIPVWEQSAAVSHYLTLPRVWEMLAGGLIFLLPHTDNRVKATLCTLAGLIAIFIPALSHDSLAAYGGPCVVLGTMLIIRYMPASILMPVLSNKPLLWIGGISFSLYLVHMPVIAFFHIWYQSVSGWGDYAIIVGLSFVLGYLFWFLVEKRRIHIGITLTVWGVGMLICVFGKSTEGFRDYLRPEINRIQVAPYDDWKFCSPETLSNKLDKKKLVYSEHLLLDLANTTLPIPRPITPLMQLGPASATPSVVLIGDSHAHSSYFGLNRLLHDINIPGAYLCTTTMPFWDKEYPSNTSYFFNKDKAEALMAWLEANPCITHVIIAQYWRLRLKEPQFMHWDLSTEPMTQKIFYDTLREFVKRIHDMNKHVILLSPCPEIPINSPTRFIRIATRKNQDNPDLSPISCTREKILELNKDVLPLLAKLQQEGLCSIVDTIPFIPEDRPYVSYRDGKFLLCDNNHLSGDGSTELFQFLKPQLEKLLRQSKHQPNRND